MKCSPERAWKVQSSRLIPMNPPPFAQHIYVCTNNSTLSIAYCRNAHWIFTNNGYQPIVLFATSILPAGFKRSSQNRSFLLKTPRRGPESWLFLSLILDLRHLWIYGQQIKLTINGFPALRVSHVLFSIHWFPSDKNLKAKESTF